MQLTELNGSILKKDLGAKGVRILWKNVRKKGDVSFAIDVLLGHKHFEIQGCTNEGGEIIALFLYRLEAIQGSLEVSSYKEMLDSLQKLLKEAK